MSTLKIETKVTGGIDAHIVYESNQPITLTKSEDGRESVDDIEVNDGILNIRFVGQGLLGTPWTLKVSELEPDERVLFEVPGIIGSTGLVEMTNARFI